MKINTALLHNFSKEKYLSYIKSISTTHHEEIKTYSTLILTLVAILFFGIFAITPTLSTIFQLHKSLEDSKFLDQQLQTKISHLSTLQRSYESVVADLPVIHAAVPQTPATTKLTGQIRTLATAAGVTLREVSAESVYVAKTGSTKPVLQPFVINITARGSSEDLLKFSDSLINFDRILSINFITLTMPQEKNVTAHQLSMQVTAYYRP